MDKTDYTVCRQLAVPRPGYQTEMSREHEKLMEAMSGTACPTAVRTFLVNRKHDSADDLYRESLEQVEKVLRKEPD